MRKTLRMAMTLAMLASLTACDFSERKDARREYASRDFQAAMADYTAGRLEAAVKGFEKAVVGDPANANARFQLACLLQEYRKDYLGAFCAYREYLMQHPRSDKAQLATDRMALCEREMAKALALRHKLLGSDAERKEIETLRVEFKNLTARNATMNRELEATRARVNSLIAERDRLRDFVRADGDESTVAVAKPQPREVKDLLEEDDSAATEKPRNPEVARLVQEEKEELASASLALPARREDDSALRAGRQAGEALAREEAARNNVTIEHPDTYVVQDGDTLYKLAIRFYGRTSAWRKIRDANRTLISNDGRVKTGDKLRLP